MFAPPTGPRSDITKHILEGHSRRTHVFSFLASVATTPALNENGVQLHFIWSANCSSCNYLFVPHCLLLLKSSYWLTSGWQECSILALHS